MIREELRHEDHGTAPDCEGRAGTRRRAPRLLRRQDDRRFQVDLEMGWGGGLVMPPGFIQGTDVEAFLEELLFPVATVGEFDALDVLQLDLWLKERTTSFGVGLAEGGRTAFYVFVGPVLAATARRPRGGARIRASGRRPA